MFGHNENEDDNKNVSSAAVTPAEPVDNGTLGGFSDGNDDNAVVTTTTLSAPPVDAEPEHPIEKTVPPLHPAEPLTASLPTPTLPPSASGDDLIGIKQAALQQLKPLVGHLDQTPEEKFRTTMMMIQAADDQTLIHEAYAAAKAIGDEKVRAQALLDVVNEINYFSSQNNPKES